MEVSNDLWPPGGISWEIKEDFGLRRNETQYEASHVEWEVCNICLYLFPLI